MGAGANIGKLQTQEAKGNRFRRNSKRRESSCGREGMEGGDIEDPRRAISRKNTRRRERSLTPGYPQVEPQSGAGSRKERFFHWKARGLGRLASLSSAPYRKEKERDPGRNKTLLRNARETNRQCEHVSLLGWTVSQPPHG